MHLIGRHTLQAATSVEGFESEAFVQKGGVSWLELDLDCNLLVSLHVCVESKLAMREGTETLFEGIPIELE